MIINNLQTKHHNDMLYDSRPVKFTEYMTNKYNILHERIYKYSLDAFIEDWLSTKSKMLAAKENYASEELYLNGCNSFVQKNPNMKYTCGKFVFDVNSVEEFKQHSFIYEIMPAEYWQPSRLKIVTKYISLSSPNLTWNVNLVSYWNIYQSKLFKNISTKKVSQENYSDAKVTNLDYLRGKATMYSKNADVEYEVDFDYLDDTVDIDDDYSLSNTFYAKY